MANERICTVCHDKYNYCPNCGKNRQTYVLFCGENCKNIYDVTSWYTADMITKKEACNKLSACDLSKRKQFSTVMNNNIDDILGFDKKAEVPERVVDSEKSFKKDKKDFHKKQFFNKNNYKKN